MRNLFLALLALASCAEPGASVRSGAPAESAVVSAAAPERATRAQLPTVIVPGVPHVRQKPDFCGEACVEMALRRLGKNLTQDDVFDRTAVDPSLGRGAYTAELKRALDTLGFQVGPVWHEVPAGSAAGELAALFATMHADLLRGVPSIVCMRTERSGTAGTLGEHFRLVVGYDSERDEVVFHEPAADEGAYQRMSAQHFLEMWPLPYPPRAQRESAGPAWTVVRFSLEPGNLATATPGRKGKSSAAFAQRVRALRERLPPGFTVLAMPPFVVAGDETGEVVRRRAESTVRWAVDKLRQDFFTAEPSEILEVMLFKDEESYREHARALYDDRPSTPYGYYSSKHGALIMNIATGGGTLVHEIVHPFMEADFPGCPPWLNEGLGSLFEQSAERDGHIVGSTNWRLAGLQRAIRARSVPSFAELTSADAGRFYDEDRGTNYAQARYLLYYLQERRLLVRFYREARAAKSRDPSAYGTLQAVLGERDMAAFQARWEGWVLRLRFPE